VPSEAEANHLAPLLSAFLRDHDRNAPDTVVRELQALALRHTAWHRTRTAALLEILDAFDRRSIDTLVLKGAALAWMIYPSPALRPMVDLDLLVPRSRADTAQAALRQLGFDARPGRRRFGRNAHHLPVAHRVDRGMSVNVEIHVDALSRDTPSSIATSNLTEPPQPLAIEGTRRLTLGHLDMLRHLTHHLFEPSPSGQVKLVGVVDLVSYACAFHEQIDWRRLTTEFGFVANALGCLHYVAPLPAKLIRFAPSAAAPAPGRIGEIVRPLRSIVMRGRDPAAMLRELFDPPGWWMHSYYNVPPAKSLIPTRVFRHPSRVARWFALRIAGL
jgi:hypothetical protein